MKQGVIGVPSPTIIDDLSTIISELERGRLRDWQSLVEADPYASFFQTPAWCLAWYAAYAARFLPRLLLVTCGEQLVGVVPLARERATGRLAFAGDNMADYRDVAARVEWRADVVRCMAEEFMNGEYTEPFVVGYTQPDSPTVGMLQALSSAGGPSAISRSHPCHRFILGAGGPDVGAILGKQSVRRHLNYYRRQGDLRLERIRDAGAWDAVCQTFYDHHTMRQLSASRAPSFTDPAKRAFFTALLNGAPENVHFSVLRVGDQVVAEHFGFIWDRLLLLGAPAFDTLEEKRSPAQLLIALLIQQLEPEGFRGLDLTIGESDFKDRFANQEFALPSAALYRSRARYLARRARDEVVRRAKAVVTTRWGADRWDRLTELAGGAGHHAPHLSADGWSGGEAWRGVPSNSAPVPSGLTMRVNHSPDLLHLTQPDDELGAVLRRVAQRRREGDHLLTLGSGEVVMFAAMVGEVVDRDLPVRLLSLVSGPEDAANAWLAIGVAASKGKLGPDGAATVVTRGKDGLLGRFLGERGWGRLPSPPAKAAPKGEEEGR